MVAAWGQAPALVSDLVIISYLQAGGYEAGQQAVLTDK